jgi:hypothetical protein
VWDPIFADARVCPQPIHALLQLDPLLTAMTAADSTDDVRAENRKRASEIVQRFPNVLSARDQCAASLRSRTVSWQLPMRIHLGLCDRQQTSPIHPEELQGLDAYLAAPCDVECRNLCRTCHLICVAFDLIPR